MALLLVPFLGELRAADYFSPAPVRFKANGFFRLATTQGRDHLVTPDGRAYVALGVNHVTALQQETADGLVVRGNAAWEAYWDQTLRARFAAWNLTTLGYGAPAALTATAPSFGSISLAPTLLSRGAQAKHDYLSRVRSAGRHRRR